MTKFDFFALMVSLLALSRLQTLFSSLLTTVSRVFRSFHNQLLNWFNGMHNTSISPANYELLFGMPCVKDNDILMKLNFCLLFTNYYLHYHKVNEKNLDWAEFTSKINYKLRIENEVSDAYA